MGAYAIPDGRPFRADRASIRRTRKKGLLDRNMELIRNSHLEFDEDKQEFILVPNERE